MIIFNKQKLCHSKIDQKEEKERKRKYNNLINNYKSINKCVINPSSIKIGCLEKCVNSNITSNSVIKGTGFVYIVEKYDPIPGEKVLIEIKPNSELYVDLDEINSNKDLEEIRNQIHIDRITIGGKILDCYSGKIRINKESL